MADQFQIEQALFGYREGHNLVASSVVLSPRVRHFLATITDASGTEMSAGFDVSYTGLPVPETDYYAVFCTWPAPEMPRPGCVWSHTLLVDLTDLARISDLSVLRSLCVRPVGPTISSRYGKPLILPASKRTLHQEDWDEKRAAFLIEAIYGHPGRSVVILDDNSFLWETIAFNIWSQQWPRLRRTFAFSTSSLGDRRMSGVAFDLQVAPLSSRRLWARGDTDTLIIQFTFKSFADGPKWIRTALEDLPIGSAGSLRRFLFDYGSDVKELRAGFIGLTECFGEELGEEDDSARKLGRVATFFPGSSDALTLKRDTLTALIGEGNSVDLKKSLATLSFLFHAKEAVAFSQVPIDFTLKTELLWQHKRADVIALLKDLPESIHAQAFISALANVLAPEDLPLFWTEQSAAIPRILATTPALPTAAAAWSMPTAGQLYLWESLHSATSDPKIWGLVCGAMLIEQCTFAEQETVALAGSYLTEGLWRWLTSGAMRLPSSAWCDALVTPLGNLLNDVTLSPPLLALTAYVLSPDQAGLLSGHRQDVQVLAREGLSDLPEPLVAPTLFWLTAVGFNTSGQDGLYLLARTFFPVYEAVERTEYSREAWERLVPALPKAMFGWDWDRCQRLRDALRHWLENNPGFAQAMSNAAPSDEYAQLVHRLY